MAQNTRSTKHREALERVRAGRTFTVDLPVVGRVRIPHPDQVAFLSALGILAAVEIIDWPVALVLAAGHMLVQDQHNRTVQEVGEALESA